MMAKKMAVFFSILGVLMFLAFWLYRSLAPGSGDVEPMSTEKAWTVGILLGAGFFMLGLFVSTLGIALVQEVMAESRSRDMERKFRAKTNYDRVMGMTTESRAVSPDRGAPSGAGNGDGDDSP